MKVYTKTGDKGTTALIGGKRVKKNHLRIEAYGNVDELIAHIAYLHDIIDNADIKQQLVLRQDECMVCAGILACDNETCADKIPTIPESTIQEIEVKIDEFDSQLPELRSFVLPCGHPTVSYCHIVRTIVRRAERVVIELCETQKVPDIVGIYLNRLSDYFFVLARKLTQEYNVKEIRWNAELE